VKNKEEWITGIWHRIACAFAKYCPEYQNLKEELSKYKTSITIDEEPVEKTSKYISNTLAPVLSKKNVRWLPLDGKYWLYSEDVVRRFIEKDWIDSKNYRRNRFDCENFAIAFKDRAELFLGTNQVAIVIDYSAAHGYNLIIYPDEKFTIFEPQNDQEFSYEDRGDMYKLERAYILI